MGSSRQRIRGRLGGRLKGRSRTEPKEQKPPLGERISRVTKSLSGLWRPSKSHMPQAASDLDATEHEANKKLFPPLFTRIKSGTDSSQRGMDDQPFNTVSPTETACEKDSASSDYSLLFAPSLTDGPPTKGMKPEEDRAAGATGDFAGLGGHLEAQGPESVEYQTCRMGDDKKRQVSEGNHHDLSLQYVPRSSDEIRSNVSTPTSMLPPTTSWTKFSSQTNLSASGSPGNRYSQLSNSTVDRASITNRSSIIASMASSVTTLMTTATRDMQLTTVPLEAQTSCEIITDTRRSSASSTQADFSSSNHREGHCVSVPGSPNPPEIAQLLESINRSNSNDLNADMKSFERNFNKKKELITASPEVQPVHASLREIKELRLGTETTSRPPLSRIDESSDAAISVKGTNPVQDPSPSVPGLLEIPTRHAGTRPELISGPPSLSTGCVSTSTPGTSIDDRSESVYAAETDDDEESLDGTSDEEDEDDPLLDAFASSSLDPGVLPLLLTIRDRVICRVECVLTSWPKSCDTDAQQDDDTGGSGVNPTPSRSASSSSPSPYRHVGSQSQNGGENSRKRALGADGADDADNGGNEDGPGKRPKTKSSLAEVELPFACPFVKRYPGDKKLSRCRKKGWPEVRRIKEHIYRKHTLQLHCGRCFVTFGTEQEKAAHERQLTVCSVIDRPTDMVGVTAETIRQLKCRKGKQKWSELLKWNNMYETLFPESDHLPSAYYEEGTLKATFNPGQAEDIQNKVTQHVMEHLPSILSDPQLQCKLVNVVNDAFAVALGPLQRMDDHIRPPPGQSQQTPRLSTQEALHTQTSTPDFSIQTSAPSESMWEGPRAGTHSPSIQANPVFPMHDLQHYGDAGMSRPNLATPQSEGEYASEAYLFHDTAPSTSFPRGNGGVTMNQGYQNGIPWDYPAMDPSLLCDFDFNAN